MRTVIVRLDAGERDALSGDRGSHRAIDPKTRQALFSRMDSAFDEVSRPVSRFISETYQETRHRYASYWWKQETLLDRLQQSQFREYGDRHILWDVLDMQDVLSSSASPIKSGILSYEKLLLSHSYVITATEDVLSNLINTHHVKDIHLNYLYEIIRPQQAILSSTATASKPGLKSWHLDRIGVPAARQLSTGRSVKVAVLDTGLDPSHPEFVHLNLASYAAWNSVGKRTPMRQFYDTDIHGTHVTGILCGANVGVAPQIDLYAGIVAPYGYATFAQINAGLDWAAAQGVDIVSMSVGKEGYRKDFEIATRQAGALGMLIISAIGNDLPGTHRSPGDYREVFSVGAIDAQDQVWVSNTDPTQGSAGGVIPHNSPYRKPDIYAPGADIYSSIPDPQVQYDYLSGTSMATPATAGVAALIKAVKPSMSAQDIRDHILLHCDTINLPTSLGDKGKLLRADLALSTI